MYAGTKSCSFLKCVVTEVDINFNVSSVHDFQGHAPPPLTSWG